MQVYTIITLIRANKNTKALTALYHYFPMVRKSIISWGGTAQDAEDTFQEALIIFCRKAKDPKFKLTSSLNTYLFGICRFLWKDELKRRKKLDTVGVETGLDIKEEQEIQHLVEKENRIKLAEKILNELGERCRELLLLFYFGKMKMKDIASKMGYGSEESVKNQKYKCLEAAKNNLRTLRASVANH